MPKKKAGQLNAQEKRFAAIYVANGRNATRAYMEIYPRAQANTASAKGSLWVRKDEVKAEIHRLTEQMFREEHMSADEALAQMARLGRSDIGDLYWKPGELDSAGNATTPGVMKRLHEMPEAVRSRIKSMEPTEWGGYKVTLWDKPSQITNALKIHKKLGGDVNVNITLGFSERMAAAKAKLLGEEKP